MTETMFPKELRAMRKFNALEELPAPKTAAKNEEAASWVEVLRVAAGTELGC